MSLFFYTYIKLIILIMKSLVQYIKEGLIQPSELGHPTDGMFDLLDSHVKKNIDKFNKQNKIEINKTDKDE